MSLTSLSDLTDGEQLCDLFFTFDGRITRKAYWLSWPAICLVFIPLMFVLYVLSLFPYLAVGLGLIAAVLLLNANIAVTCKRLHDRGKSGWWLLFFYVAPEAVQMIGRLTGASSVAIDLLSWAIFIWAMVELGCLRGTAGPNRYGPDPLPVS